MSETTSENMSGNWRRTCPDASTQEGVAQLVRMPARNLEEYARRSACRAFYFRNIGNGFANLESSPFMLNMANDFATKAYNGARRLGRVPKDYDDFVSLVRALPTRDEWYARRELFYEMAAMDREDVAEVRTLIAIGRALKDGDSGELLRYMPGGGGARSDNFFG